MIDKAQSREIRRKIRQVLLETWDPIGIQDEPNTQDEYDSYIGMIYDLLMSGPSDPDLVEFLFSVVHENMGLDAATREDMLPTVVELRKISVSQKSREENEA